VRALAGVPVVLAATIALAAGDPLPTGRVSAVIGAKTGTGSLASSIGNGFALGFEACYAPLAPPQTIGFGVTWSTVWSYYGTGSARIADSLAMVELDLGVRLRLLVGTRRDTVVFLGGGANLVRTNEPLFDGGDRSSLGPWGSAGIEGARFGWVFAASLRFGAIENGQGTLGILFTVGKGR
jgi:hypothetical protein